MLLRLSFQLGLRAHPFTQRSVRASLCLAWLAYSGSNTLKCVPFACDLRI